MTTFRAGDSPNPLPKHLLTSKEGEDQLQPYKALLEECIQYGWDAWDRDYAHKHHILSARSRSALVFDEIVFHAQEKFDGLAGVKFDKRRNSFLLYIGDNIIIRFKKIGKNGKCSSIATHQQVLFSLQIELPGMEKGTMLHAGYALDDMQRQIVRKMIVCQYSNRVVWKLDLESDEKENVLAIPSPSIPEPKEGPRFTVKPEVEKDSQKTKPKKRAADRG